MAANRSRDWWKQAQHDLGAARENTRLGIHDWACFMAQQAAEKALKALIQHLGGDAWGHSARELAALLPEGTVVPNELWEGLSLLDRYYIPTRYPNGIASGTPAETYGSKDAETAIALSHEVLRFVAGHLPRSSAGD
jgi:HEPN domain-containing protein